MLAAINALRQRGFDFKMGVDMDRLLY